MAPPSIGILAVHAVGKGPIKKKKKTLATIRLFLRALNSKLYGFRVSGFGVRIGGHAPPKSKPEDRILPPSGTEGATQNPASLQSF